MIKNNFYQFFPLFLFRKGPGRSFTKYFLFPILLFLILIADRASATHISGASLTYRWVTGNTFELHLTLYRDCSGIAAPNSVSVNCNSLSCGYTINMMLNRIGNTGMEVTRPCDSAATTCTGGNNPGIQKFEYTADITLPGHCTDWVFGYSICCRNCAITTISYTPNNCAGVPGTYVEARLNNFLAPANSSPAFTNDPVYFYCIGQPFQYNMGAIDPDGDSLVYSLVNPQSSPVNNLVFNPGYSPSSPISSSPPLSLSQNGDIKITPTAPEVGVMAVKIEEYRNGVFIGSVVQDIEMWTSNCTNNLPTATGINGTSVFETTVCPGTPVNFNILSADADPGQVVTMSWNNGIPAGTFSSTSNSFPTGTFSWTPTLADVRSQPYEFTVTVTDNNCPMKGFQIYSYSIKVSALSVSMNATNSACASPGTGSIVAIPSGTGPFQYSWSTGSTGTNTISGLGPGTYSVTVTNGLGCTVSTNATISAPPPVNISLLSMKPILCNNDKKGSLNVGATGGTGPYTYSWSTGATGPTIVNLLAGTYTVSVADQSTCTSSASYTLTQPSQLNTAVNFINVSCYGNATGSISLTTSGGTGNYLYAWSNGDTASNLTQLSAGNYSVIVSDENACSLSRNITISEPPQISISHTATDATCGLSNGSISTVVSGGTGPITFDWNPGHLTSSSLSGLDAGLYTLTATDTSGCTAVKSIPLSNNGGPVITLQSLSSVKCKGGSDGAISVNVAGGQNPYTYQWLPALGNVPAVSGLVAGSYALKVTDANNCTSSTSFNITEPAALSNSIISVNPNCGNASNGSAIASVNGGTPPYTYNWQPGNINVATLNNIGLGHYTVQITDANGCKRSDSIDITRPLPIIGSVISNSPVSCFGAKDGSADVTASGGLPPFRYDWSVTGDTLPFASGLGAGNYLVTVTDASNCTQNIQVVITEPALLTGNISSFRNASCQLNNGFAVASFIGGNQPYQYLWTPNGDTSVSISNLSPGLYTVTAQDAKGCSASASVSINRAAQLALSLISSTGVSCKGGQDGTGRVAATGGVPPYSYRWNPSGGNTAVAANLATGNYSVTVTDASLCTANITVSISEPDSLSTTLLTSDITCFGGNDGTASLTVSGGTAPYSYAWNNGGGNASFAFALNGGNYSVTTTDSKGCSKINSFTINQPTKINLAMAATSSACGASFGSLHVIPSGGVPGYSYSWSPVNSTDSIVNNLPGGVYTVTVEDANGCTASGATVIINNTSPVVSSGTVVPVSCFGGNDGSASLNISGGSGPFSYQWSPAGGTNSSANGLRAGNYSIRITDGFGCLTFFSVSIPEPQPLQVLKNSTPANCFGTNSGSALVNVLGGTSPYSFLWSNGSTGISANNLPAGNISITVTDQKGCKDSSTINISQPAQLNASLSNLSPVSCHGGNDGSANVFTSGGNPPYTYSWNPSGNTGASAGGLTAGNYTVTITDQSGCSTITGVIISEPPALTLQTSSVSGSCSLPNGSVSVTASGGTAPYSYLWDHSGETTQSVSGLNPGNFSVTVSDMNGCQSSISASVTNSGNINASLTSVTPVTCYGGNDGAANINASGGLPPFTFSWQPSGGQSAIANGLTAGTYQVIVTDAVNCTKTLNVVIPQPPQLKATINTKNITCNGAGNGSALVNATGGTGALSCQWQPGGLISPAIGGLQPGNYSVEISDTKGCTLSKPVTITEPLPISLTTNSIPAGCLLHNGSAWVNVNGGTVPYTYMWNPGVLTDSVANGISAGTYIVDVTDLNNCYLSTSVAVSNTTGPTASLASSTPVTCFGGNDGSAAISANGIYSPFQYNWFPYGGHDTAASDLEAGNYSFTVRDSNNCLTAVQVTISQPNPLVSAVTTSDVTCFGRSDGGVHAATSGGIAPYRYVWSTGDTSLHITNLPAGNYTLTTTDANGCKSTNQATVGSPSPLGLNIQKTDVTCNGFTNGAASAFISGGTPGYSYTWSNGSTTSDALNLAAGNYLVSISDLKGCRVDSLLTIREPSAIVTVINTADATCKGKADGNASLNVSGGIPPYTYQWMPGGGNADHAINLPEGAYSVVITDGNQCSQTQFVNIGAPPQLAFRVVTGNATCSGSPDGFAEVIASGGTTPYSYFWTNGSDSSSAKNLLAGNYTTVITDKNSCIASSSITIQQPQPVLVTLDNPAPICIGEQAELLVHCSGGTPGYAYSWSNGANAALQFVSPQQNSIYVVTARDTNGCVSNSGVALVIVKPPLAVLSGIPDTVCKGSSALLTATASGGGGTYSYVWSTGEKGEKIKVTPDTTTIYHVTVSDQCSTPPAIADIPVIVSPLPVVDFSADTLSGCQPLEVAFRDLTNASSFDYYWNFGDGETDITRNPTHVYLYPGNYSVNHIVKDYNGCIGKKVIASAIKVFPQSVADFSESPETASILNPLISFFNQSSNTHQWEWDFGDGSANSPDKNTEHAYKDTGTYFVRLISISDKNCRDTAYGKVTIKDEFAFYIPNAFTPNGDEINEIFSPLGIGILEFDMLIFDRWGLQIFHSTDILKGWNGKMPDNNSPCPEDVYVYRIRVKDINRRSHDYVGHVNLVR